jgi:hypothetical protein
VTRREPIKEKQRITGYQEVEADPGVSDKRLLAAEPEFGGTLKVLQREGNDLGAIMRQAWDGIDLRTLTRNSPLKATGAHVSILAHITKDELMRLMAQGDLYNGMANRFLWVAAKRSKLLPFGGSPDEANLAALARVLRDAADFGKALATSVRRDAEADRLWEAAYPALSAGRPGVLGAVTSRAEAHVMRLALLYAILDRSTTIKAEHLRAALELWGYCERSAAYIFGASTGDPKADKLLEALRSSPAGLTREEIRDTVFKRNLDSAAIAAILAKLASWGLAHRVVQPTGGRPAERWFAGPPPTP